MRTVLPLTHAHGGHVILISLSDFLHDLLLGPTAVLNGALHSDGPFRVIERELLEPGKRSGQSQAVGSAGLEPDPS